MSFVVVVVERELAVLAVHRRENPAQRCLPGGAVEPGETPRAAAARELAEETGLVVPEANLEHVGNVAMSAGAVAVFVAQAVPSTFSPAPTQQEPELLPHWTSWDALCDDRNGRFSFSASHAWKLTRTAADASWWL